MEKDARDDLFSRVGGGTEPFRFDDAVVRVFSDMVSRSVPCYEQLVQLGGLLGRRFVSPTPDALVNWLGHCGFRNARAVDVATTRVAEQRSTEWMRFQSLANCLDPRESSLTVEGLPAPRRGIVLADAT